MTDDAPEPAPYSMLGVRNPAAATMEPRRRSGVPPPAMSTAVLPRVLPVASLLALTLATAAPAQAEELRGFRSDAVAERSHEIRLTLEHGQATLRVRRTVHNGGESHDQATFRIDVPQTAVATGLRTLGLRKGKPHWYAGDLLDAQLAADRYQELTGIGAYEPRDPALLRWVGMSELALQVFPVAPATDKTVEYTLQMPTTYFDGRDLLVLPPMGTEGHPARVALHPAHPRDQLFVDGEPVASGAVLVLDGEHELSLSRHDAPRIDASLASVPFGDGRVLLHYDVALAPRISSVPRDARVVVVIDGSRSLSPEQREAARATAAAYLQHFAGPRSRARAEVLVFDHEVHARHGRMVPVRRALADLEHLDLPETNGSRLDDALAVAAKRLASGPKGARRILVLTDARTRDDLDPVRLEALAGLSDAIVHVGVVDTGRPSLVRDDEHPWAEVASATGGVVWRLRNGPDDDDALEVFEELARPVRLDHLQVMIPPQPQPDPIMFSDALDEGQGFESLELVDAPVRHLRIEGQLWSEPVRETVFPDDEQGRRWAALVFGSERLHELSEDEMMMLAVHGGAVSPVTSYLAIEPGVRPSTEGLEEGAWGLGMTGVGEGGGGTGWGTIGLGSVGTLGPDPRQEALERDLRAALDACGGAGAGAHVELETTSQEIVEIDDLEVLGSPDPVLAPCLRQRTWAMMLGSEFHEERRTWTIDLPG